MTLLQFSWLRYDPKEKPLANEGITIPFGFYWNELSALNFENRNGSKLQLWTSEGDISGSRLRLWTSEW
ncbi:hypothetical protein RhiirA4_461850 [Rhizophagus irregularis]|uniref:Uncharacterized protein n=1 Tax=Rhizophagus irregularis TaxID=588596 RepID=A0A2I1GJQ8_9GLOM|nr:hypothetical protein RhiirA4_461850 [Rhizophagus irregularis]